MFGKNKNSLFWSQVNAAAKLFEFAGLDQHSESWQGHYVFLKIRTIWYAYE